MSDPCYGDAGGFTPKAAVGQKQIRSDQFVRGKERHSSGYVHLLSPLSRLTLTSEFTSSNVVFGCRVVWDFLTE